MSHGYEPLLSHGRDHLAEDGDIGAGEDMSHGPHVLRGVTLFPHGVEETCAARLQHGPQLLHEQRDEPLSHVLEHADGDELVERTGYVPVVFLEYPLLSSPRSFARCLASATCSPDMLHSTP